MIYTLPDDFFKNVHGFISLPEAELLNTLASSVPSGGVIVEIGSFQARSTVALALGAKETGAMVYAIDPHPTYDVDDTQFSMADNQIYYENIVNHNVGDVVKTVNLSSAQVSLSWHSDIDLLFIDGDHDFEEVRSDWTWWSPYASVVALHDTAGHHAGVDKVVMNILASGEWQRSEVVDSITVFRKNEGSR